MFQVYETSLAKRVGFRTFNAKAGRINLSIYLQFLNGYMDGWVKGGVDRKLPSP